MKSDKYKDTGKQQLEDRLEGMEAVVVLGTVDTIVLISEG